METVSFVLAGVFWIGVILNLVFTSRQGHRQTKALKPALDGICVLMIFTGLLMGTVVVESIVSS